MERAYSPSEPGRSNSAVRKLMILLQPGDAVRREGPYALRQQHGEAFLAQRLQVERCPHVAVTATDCLVDLGDCDAPLCDSARRAPQRLEDASEVSATHGLIVADGPRDRRPRPLDCGPPMIP